MSDSTHRPTPVDLARLSWFTSSFSGGSGNCVEVAAVPTVWVRSSHSGSNNCVEVAALPAAAAVRDSKDPDGGVLVFPAEGWRAFVAGAAGGRFTPND